MLRCMSPFGAVDFAGFFLKPAHKSRVTQQSLTANFQTAPDEPYDANVDFDRSIRDFARASPRAARDGIRHEGKSDMSTETARLNERFERTERAYVAALGGRQPELVSAFDLLPAIFEAVPDTTPKEIADALRWSARKDFREADRLERTRRK